MTFFNEVNKHKPFSVQLSSELHYNISTINIFLFAFCIPYLVLINDQFFVIYFIPFNM